jgi:eukaryotic-like serine/threonine-protein kinase
MRPRALQGPDFGVIHRAAPPLPPGRESAGAQARQLVELLGRGGGARVWRAVDRAGRSVALKIPHEALDRAADASDHPLAREHALLAQLAHRNVVGTRGLVEHAGKTVLALEYLPGGDLVSLAGAHPRHWIDAARAVHAALAHLHERGFVHRDVKARNVLFDADGRARLIDFASVLPCGAPAGSSGTTAAHRAPGRRDAAAPRDDAFAFAVLLYELLAGRLPRGPGGCAAEGGPAWPVAADAAPAVTALAARVLEVLRSEDAGLSAFTDVLESAAAAFR